MSNTSIRTKVTNTTKCTNGILFLQLKRPEGFEYQGGQFIEIQITKVGEWYPFSLASSPLESELLIVTRLRDTAFKRQLGSLEIGDEVALTGPWGNLVLPKTLPPKIGFLAGGLGINPVRSMLYGLMTDQSEIVVLHSVPDKETTLFEDELRVLPISYIPTFTKRIDDSVMHERGRITSSMIHNHLTIHPEALIYIIGSAHFVQSMVEEVIRAGFHRDQLRVETFTGY